jgi:hypothetical protein
VCQVVASDSECLVLYDLFMLLLAQTCYNCHNCLVMMLCLLLVRNICLAVMGMLVKICDQFGYIFLPELIS